LGREAQRLLACGERDASLVSQVERGTRDTVRERDVDGLARAVDHRLPYFGTLLVWRREETEVLHGELGRQVGDEHGGADDLGKTGRVVLQGVARRGNVGCAELERLGARDQRRARFPSARRDQSEQQGGGDK